MSDAPRPSDRAAEYLKQAEKMRVAADRVFDPQVASQFLALSAAWLRLAEEAQKGVRYIDRSAADHDQKN